MGGGPPLRLYRRGSFLARSIFGCPQFIQDAAPAHAPYLRPAGKAAAPAHAPYLRPAGKAAAPAHAPYLRPAGKATAPAHAPYLRPAGKAEIDYSGFKLVVHVSIRGSVSNMITTGQRLAQLLDAYGVEIISGIPGTHIIELYRGLSETSIRHITPRHEQGAGFLADGYARVTGKPAVCVTISGPGALNITTAMGQALADSIPVLVISADNKTYHKGLGEGRLHEINNIQAVMAECSRWCHTMTRPDELPSVLARAFGIFKSERPGPVHLTIPLDVITADASHVCPEAWPLPLPPAPHPQSLNAAARRLNNAERPVLALGGGAADLGTLAVAIAEKLDAPVTTTHNAKGLLPADHPLYVGGNPSHDAIQTLYVNADAVLAIGTELGETDYDYFFTEANRMSASLIRVDIDPRQLSRNKKPAVAVHGDATLTVRGLLPLLDSAVKRHGSDIASQARELIRDDFSLSFQRLFSTLQETLPNLVLIGDSTQAAYAAAPQYDAPAPRSFAAAGCGFGTLGLAMPAAIGAKLGQPDRPVVALVGDGGMQFTLNELSTAVEAGVSIAVLIWNNQCYGEIARNFRDSGMAPIACDIHTPDFVAIAKAYGCEALRVENHQALAAALTDAQARNLPTVIELPEHCFLDQS